jgi:hypothetical protein
VAQKQAITIPIRETTEQEVMAWRAITKDDIKLGTLVKLGRMIDDGSYGMATIIYVHDHPERGIEGKNFWAFVKVARPYAYANEGYSSNQPLLGAEVFEIGIKELLSDGCSYQVFQGRDDIRKMAT